MKKGGFMVTMKCESTLSASGSVLMGASAVCTLPASPKIRSYLRTSTDLQTTESQRHAIAKWADGRQVIEYADDAFSGSNQDRPSWQRLLSELRQGDTLVVYALDRLTREGIVETLKLREMFQSLGVKLVSVSESWVSVEGPVGDLISSVMAWAAQQERLRIKARSKAGIEAAKKANGGKVPWGGRKRGCQNKQTKAQANKVKRLYQAGRGISEIATLTGLSRPTIYAIVRDLAPDEQPA